MTLYDMQTLSQNANLNDLVDEALEVARSVLKDGHTVQKAAEVSGLSVDKLRDLLSPWTMPLEEYRRMLRLRNAREEGFEIGLEIVARSMMARGTPLLEVAETLGLPTERLQQLQPH